MAIVIPTYGNGCTPASHTAASANRGICTEWLYAFYRTFGRIAYNEWNT
ncbi:hypothetical protein SAMN05660909_00262 [Chitinophaga terrae (ex Kim and Jung 2007)]|uniref:Uncharacterized protein n=1 Tax=Chitinophaga terrae (ex Kim and Jung 2007) TaxID=408074 RepID=A0A1H3X6D7_9BACT|nr:hypothetical protein [Chitinophaga terrae (ex Kim and Jung 2007)]SDZ94204.1 hypothetical protein SAMN05660909_00262 [Chitinophaga terrae (ex Kim and Jung 2007)]